MRASLINLSLIANVGLLAALFWLNHRPALTGRTPDVAPAPNTTARVFRTPPLQTLTSSPALEPRPSFHWSQIESDNYETYIRNLRSIGCPQSTLRDIIAADLNELFSARVKTLVDSVQGQFWDLLANKEEFEKMISEKHQALQELELQRSSLLRHLLGHSSTDPA